jgi:uncharacterized membrane protein
MAGIGFELRKLVETRTLRGILGAAFSGTLVVAGPWLISAASLAAAERLLFSQSGGMPLAFTGAMVWALAISICASAAPLYIFVRLSADLIYIGNRGEAVTLLLKYAAATALVSLPAGFALSLLLVRSADQALLGAAFALLLTAVNVLWAAMVTATAIKRYGRILAAYALGMALMYFLAKSLSAGLGAAGTVLALAAGFALTAILLIAVTVEALGTAPCPKAFRRLFEYAAKYRNLAVAGLCYALATWADKAVLALFGGVSAEGTLFLVNPGYDTAYYYSNLALIPGLVFFTIVTETEFALDLRRLISHLGHKRQPEIEAASARLVRSAALSLGRQSAFQAAVVAVTLLVAPDLAALLGFPAGVFARLLMSTFFQLILLTSLNMLFYLELYKYAALSALAFLLADLGLSVAACLSGHSAALQGLPYLAACLVSAAMATFYAFRDLGRFDSIVFLRASGQEYGR